MRDENWAVLSDVFDEPFFVFEIESCFPGWFYFEEFLVGSGCFVEVEEGVEVAHSLPF